MLADLERNARNRKAAMEHLVATYGTKGTKGWSLTEVLQLRRHRRTRMMDLLAGIVKGKANKAAMYPGRFRLKTMNGQPLEFERVLPDPDEEPALVEEARPEGDEPEYHYHPNQWIPVKFQMDPETDVPLADDHNPTNCATWLLLWYGWGARQGGSSKRRYGNKKALRSGEPESEWDDKWLVYEEAYRERHPEAFARNGSGGKVKPSTTKEATR
jgi:hypothetical protein